MAKLRDLNRLWGMLSGKRGRRRRKKGIRRGSEGGRAIRMEPDSPVEVERL
jgi:hypothetical protein